MEIKILRYTPTPRDLVQGFCDLEIDGWIRLNGLHLLRDGSVQSAKLTPFVKGRRLFISAIEIMSPTIHTGLSRDIADAIGRYLEALPPDKRSLPPLTEEDRSRIAQREKQREAASRSKQSSSGKQQSQRADKQLAGLEAQQLPAKREVPAPVQPAPAPLTIKPNLKVPRLLAGYTPGTK